MTIHLVGGDDELYALCREIVSEIPEIGHSSRLERVISENDWCDADLHIWNYYPGLVFPADAKWNASRHIFVVDSAVFAEFKEHTGGGIGNVVLKPVSRGMLTPFLLAPVSIRAANTIRADRDDILQCLIQTNLKLQEYNHQRTAFLARALNDFRAPLTALGGYCGLLLNEPLGPLTQRQSEVLRRMQNSAKRLSRIASTMYEVSANGDAEQCPNLQPGDIHDCVQRALDEIAPFADEKSISITVDLEQPDAELRFEAKHVQQVLINLLDNACRFTPRAGFINIRGYPFFWERRDPCNIAFESVDRRRRACGEANSYRLEITDSGSAIPEEHLETLFEEYTSYAGDRSGGGLGLVVCKKIISQHSGRIWAENRDGRSAFSFVLPTDRMSPRLASEADSAPSSPAAEDAADAD